MSNQNPNASEESERIKGWKAISAFTGWSIRNLQYMESEGLPIQREHRGNRVFVFSNKEDLVHFLETREETKKPSEKRPNWYRFRFHLASVAVSVTLAFAAFFFLNPSEKLSLRISWNEENERATAELRGRRNEMVQTFTTPIVGSDRYVTKLLLRSRFALNTNRDVCLFIDGSKLAYATVDGEKGGIPNSDSLISKDGHVVQDLESLREVRFEATNQFQGWLVTRNSSLDFAGTLHMFNKDRFPQALIAHPGHLVSARIWREKLFVAGCLNLREHEWQPFRLVVFRVDLSQALSLKRCQILVDDRSVSPGRRLHYVFDGLHILRPEKYLAFDSEMSAMTIHIKRATDEEIWIVVGRDDEFLILTFDWDLTYKRHNFVTQTLSEGSDTSRFLESVAFSYLQDGKWSPAISIADP